MAVDLEEVVVVFVVVGWVEAFEEEAFEALLQAFDQEALDQVEHHLDEQGPQG